MNTLKFVICSSLIGLFSINCFAEQIENPTRKGRFLGEFDFGSDSGDLTQEHDTYVADVKIDQSLLRIDGRLGYTVFDNLVVGLAIGHDHEKLEVVTPDMKDVPDTGNTTVNTETGGFIGLGATYYFLEEQFKPFLGIAIGRTHVNVEIEGAGNVTDLSGDGFGYALDLGFAYFINDHIGFEARYVNFNSSNSVSGGGNASGFEYDLAYDDDQSYNALEFGYIITF
jgi:outer membrane protein W